MKGFFLIFLSVISFLSLNAQDFSITGRLMFKEPADKAVLYYYTDYTERKKIVLDSSNIDNGKFILRGKLSEPKRVILSIKFSPKDNDPNLDSEKISVFIESGNVHLIAKDSLKYAKIKGSKFQAQYETYNRQAQPFVMKVKELSSLALSGKVDVVEHMEKYISIENDRAREITIPFIKHHPSSPVSLYLVEYYMRGNYDLQLAEIMFLSLSEKNKNSVAGQVLKKHIIDIPENTSVGAIAMDFRQPDTLGRVVSLSDFKGRYVLIDFWASWCAPCRIENPYIVKAFQKFKSKNFTVLGVSLDSEGRKQAWLDAIHKDNLTWTHVSDLKGWDNEVAKQYGIKAIPQNFLIDPDGKIVATNLKGDKLEQKLSEIIID